MTMPNMTMVMITLMIFTSTIPCCTMIIPTHKLTLALLSTTILWTIMMTMMMSPSVFPFILYLTVISGMMILFLYMTSMYENKTHPSKMTKMMMMTTIMMILIPSVYLNMKMKVSMKSTLNYPIQEPTIMIFSPTYMPTTIIMLLILMFLLISTIKICLKVNKPIRRSLKFKE